MSMMPVLSPAGVQEILDFGLYGFALSRFAGVWVGAEVMKDTVEVTRWSTAARTGCRSSSPISTCPRAG
jgi:TPP-dependent indolepyruvate ferredoxin oxidoreductase alpha subunit